MSLSLPKMSLSSIDSLKSMTTIHIFIICALETLILNEKMGAGFKPFLKVVPPSASNSLPQHFVHADSEERMSLIETSMPLFAMLLYFSELSGWKSWSSKTH